MTESEIQQFFLTKVRDEWKSLLESWDSRPWGVWVRQYKMAGENQNGFSVNHIPIRVWFLNETGILRKEVNEFQRFITYQSGSTWSPTSFNFTENNPLWSSGNKSPFHEIGLSSFAKIEGSDSKYYFESIWGGRFGRGMSVEFRRNNNEHIWNNIWVS